MLLRIGNNLINLLCHLLVLTKEIWVVITVNNVTNLVELLYWAWVVLWDLATDDKPLSVLFFKESNGWVEHHQGQEFVSHCIILLAFLIRITSAMAQRRFLLTCSRGKPSLYQWQIGRQVSLFDLIDVGIVNGSSLLCYHILQTNVVVARGLVRAKEISESATCRPH